MNALGELFDHTGDGACTLDKNQRIISWNTAATEMLGYSREEALGQVCWELLFGHTPDGKPFCRPSCTLRQKLQMREAITSLDLLLRHRAGNQILVNVSTIPIPEALNGGRPGMLVHLWRLRGQPATAKRLRIYLLGPTSVTRADGTLVEGGMWNRAKVRALLVYLALQGGQPVSRERLIEVLWPDFEYKEALHNLNTTVYHLRHSLEPNLKKASDSAYIGYHSGQYFLIDAQQHWLDVLTFEDNIRRARLEKELHGKIDAYLTAIALYRGDYLADLDATGLQSSSEQVRYQLLCLAAMQELGEAYEALGEPQEAIHWYQQVLSMEPCHEQAGIRLVRLFVRQGRRAEALRVCEALAARLEEELDAAISTELEELMTQIRLMKGISHERTHRSTEAAS